MPVKDHLGWCGDPALSKEGLPDHFEPGRQGAMATKPTRSLGIASRTQVTMISIGCPVWQRLRLRSTLKAARQLNRPWMDDDNYHAILRITLDMPQLTI